MNCRFLRLPWAFYLSWHLLRCYGLLRCLILIADARRRVGVLGGSLDPIHIGHLAAARAALEQLDLDEVLIAPAGQPWQKSGQALAAAPDRLTMAQLSVDELASVRPNHTPQDGAALKMVVSDVDVRRPGPTYTVDTMIDVRREEPPARWWFIVGADALVSVPTWHQAERLGGLARFAVVPRPGFEISQIDSAQEKMIALSAPIEVDLIDMPAIAVSSSAIREAVASGASIRGMVTDSVAAYITQHGLYR